MYALCANCQETIRPDETASNLYVHVGNGTDQCHTMATARATLGIQVDEHDDRTILAIGAETTEEGLEALRKYKKDVFNLSLDEVRVENYTVRKDYVREAKSPDAETVKLIVVPNANDLDGYTPMITFNN